MAETIAAALWEAGFADSAVFFLGNASFINAAVVVAANYANTQDQRRRARNQGRDAFNASLQDRQITLRTAVGPRNVVYGRDVLGGYLADAFSTGSKGEYLHLVIAYAGHECDAVETILFNNIALPAPDGSGNITSGVWAKTTTTNATETVTAAGSLTLAHTPTQIVSVVQVDGGGTDQTSAILTSPSGYTLSGSVVTFVPGAAGNRTYTVNYDWQQTDPRVRVKVHLGQAGQTADSDLVAESAGRWTSADVGQGICYVYYRLQYDTEVFGQTGIPDIKVVLRGKKVLDPRSSTTAWSPNAALCVRDWMRDTYHGLECTGTEVPDAEVNTAANVSDEEVTLYSAGTVSVTNGSATVTGSGTAWLKNCYPGLLFALGSARYTVASVASDTSLTLTGNFTGTTASGQAYSLRQLRYTVNGTLTTGDSDTPLASLRKVLGAMAGSAVWVQGRFLVRAGAYIAPDVTWNEDYLADGSISIVPKASRREQCNRVTGKYLDAADLYAEKQYPAVVNTTYKAADGGQELSREVSLWGVTDSFRAQRLGKIELERSRLAQTVRLTTNWRGYDRVPTDTLNLSLTRYGYDTSIAWDVRGRKLLGDGRIEYVLRQTASTVFTWNLGEQTTYNPSATTTLPNPLALPAALAGLACDSSATVNGNVAKALVVRGLVTWTATTDVFVQQGGRIELGWKYPTDADWQTNAPLAGNATAEYITPLQPSTVVLVRIRAVNAAGRAGPYSYISHAVQSGGAIGGGNLLANSSFEARSGGSSAAPDGWAVISSGTTGTITHGSAGGRNGGTSQRISASNLGTTSADYIGYRQVVPIDYAVAGSRMLGSFHAQTSVSGQPLQLYVEFLDGSSTVIGSSGTNFAGTTTGIPRYVADVAATVPAGAVSARFTLLAFARPGAAGAVDVYFDEAQFEPGAVLTAYAPKTEEILAGAVGTEQIATDAVTTVKIVNGGAASVQSSEPSASSVSWGAGTFDLTHPNASIVGSLNYTNNTGRTIRMEMSAAMQGYGSGWGGTAQVNLLMRARYIKTVAGTDVAKSFPVIGTAGSGGGSAGSESVMSFASDTSLNNGDTLTFQIEAGGFAELSSGTVPAGSVNWKNASMRLTAVLA